MKIYFEEQKVYELDSCDARYDLAAGFSEDYDESSRSVEGGKFLGQLTKKCEILKEEYAALAILILQENVSLN
jgi:hypothetical protein